MEKGVELTCRRNNSGIKLAPHSPPHVFDRKQCLATKLFKINYLGYISGTILLKRPYLQLRAQLTYFVSQLTSKIRGSRREGF